MIIFDVQFAETDRYQRNCHLSLKEVSLFAMLRCPSKCLALFLFKFLSDTSSLNRFLFRNLIAISTGLKFSLYS
jgi:hypothetical protein